MFALRRTATLLCAAAVLGCSPDSGSDVLAPSGVRINAVNTAAQPDMLPDSHGHRLTAVAGEGEGMVNVSPEASEAGLNVEIEVAVWKTSPNTTFNVKRASNVTADGVCTSSTFIQFPLPNPGPLVTLTTSEGGAGSTHIKFDRPQIPDGTRFAVRYEVSTPDGSIVLRSECFTVSIK
ncbi:MAG: hypothetical protein ABR499_19465 [Gemmatimonadaceae bacterium]